MCRAFPIGISNFKKIIEGNYYYSDKTLLVKEIIDCGADVILIPRPRRFGKTLNMMMLKYFFETADSRNCHSSEGGHPSSSSLNRHLFNNLEIEKHENAMSHQGIHPVIFMSFKDIKVLRWEESIEKLMQIISEEFQNHEYLLKSNNISEIEKESISRIISKKATVAEYETSLKLLSSLLEKHHKIKPVILIDEYDTPIVSGHFNNYYNEIVGFLRNFFSAGLKDNVSLFKGVMTGILRIAKESIFSGLNNLDVWSILSNPAGDKFGLTDNDVRNILKERGIPENYNDVRNWYNGYLFGKTEIYNPWSIINYAEKYDEGFKPYWVNTATNELIDHLATNGGRELKIEIEMLLKNEGIEKIIEENIVFSELETRDDLLWSFLYFSGYLKTVSKRYDEDGLANYYTLMIPNLEVKSAYLNMVKHWFSDKKIPQNQIETMLKYLLSGDIESFSELFSKIVETAFSYHDLSGEPENFYHAFVLGLFVWLGSTHEVKSNRESGFGRYDICLIPKNILKTGFVIEFKRVGRKETVESAIESALSQIETKNYAAELTQRGIKKIKKLAIVFNGKEVEVKEG